MVKLETNDLPDTTSLPEVAAARRRKIEYSEQRLGCHPYSSNGVGVVGWSQDGSGGWTLLPDRLFFWPGRSGAARGWPGLEWGRRKFAFPSSSYGHI